MRQTGQTLTDQFIQQMIDQIMTGEKQAGQQLPTERELSETLHVSRAVVNTGMKKLEEMGFVEIIPRKGTFITDFTKHGKVDVINAIMNYNGMRFRPEYFGPLLETREIMEPEIMKLAAKKQDIPLCNHAEAILNEMSETHDPQTLSALAQEFIRTLADATENIIMPLLANTFSKVYITMGIAIFRSGFSEIDLDDLRKLLSAIRSGKEQEAYDIDLDHITKVRKWIERHYEPGTDF